MGLFGKNKAPEVQEPMDLDAVMKKYDRESNTRIWEGKPKMFVTAILAIFSLFSNYIKIPTVAFGRIQCFGFFRISCFAVKCSRNIIDLYFVNCSFNPSSALLKV